MGSSSDSGCHVRMTLPRVSTLERSLNYGSFAEVPNLQRESDGIALFRGGSDSHSSSPTDVKILRKTPTRLSEQARSEQVMMQVQSEPSSGEQEPLNEELPRLTMVNASNTRPPSSGQPVNLAPKEAPQWMQALLTGSEPFEQHSNAITSSSSFSQDFVDYGLAAEDSPGMMSTSDSANAAPIDQTMPGHPHTSSATAYNERQTLEEPFSASPRQVSLKVGDPGRCVLTDSVAKQPPSWLEQLFQTSSDPSTAESRHESQFTPFTAQAGFWDASSTEKLRPRFLSEIRETPAGTEIWETAASEPNNAAQTKDKMVSATVADLAGATSSFWKGQKKSHQLRFDLGEEPNSNELGAIGLGGEHGGAHLADLF